MASIGRKGCFHWTNTNDASKLGDDAKNIMLGSVVIVWGCSYLLFIPDAFKAGWEV